MRSPSEIGRQLRYAEVTQRLNTTTIAGATAISLLTMVATWGDWRAFTIVALTQVALIPFNTFVTMVLLKRWEAVRAERWRTVINLTAAVVSGHFAGWPFPMWLWLPFIALAFDQLSPRISWTILVAAIVVNDLFGLLGGAFWIYPLTFTFLALFCAQISTVKFGVIRDMLLAADAQRSALERSSADLQQAHERLKQEILAREAIEIELRQAQKLEAVGRLASGIAHEINTPVQFVSDNVNFLKSGASDLLALIERYRAALESCHDADSEREARLAIAKAAEELDFAYLSDHLPNAGDRSIEGLERIAAIVRSMKDFAHPDQKAMAPAELNSAIQTTLTIARSEYKDVADVETDLGALPLVTCHLGELNQVILNLLINAAHAIGDAIAGTGKRGLIGVRTQLEGEDVLISISDTGVGIPEEIRHRVFDPFFTTKEVGRGTGQGLAIARSVIRRHRGTLTFESEVGAGTTFWIRIPAQQPSQSGDFLFGEAGEAAPAATAS